ncbi:MAG: hypothetical protein WCS87_09680 [Methylococcaceae bacterium]
MSELDKKILKIATEAVKKAQKDSLQKGIANVYSKNGTLFFQLPDGTVTQEIPEEYRSERFTHVIRQIMP